MSKPPLQLAELNIENIRCFDRVELSFCKNGKTRKRSLIIGENGHGKSTLLRAIAIGLCPVKEANALIDMLSGPMIRVPKKKPLKDPKPGRIEVKLVDPAEPESEYRIITHVRCDQSGQEILEKETFPKEFPWSRVFACGYGVNRGTERYVSMSGYALRPSLQSLFSEESSLYNPEEILRNFKLAASESEEGRAIYEDGIRHLKDILGLKTSHKIEISTQGVIVHGKWSPMPFHALGDGYRGTSAWLLDFLGRSLQANISWRKSGKFSGPSGGIVLIDEIDEHLHPSWQRDILSRLSKRFPHVQFIGTTHSPMTIINCRPDEVISCRLHNTLATVDHHLGSLEGHTADQILRGEWFGLKETMADKTEKLLQHYRLAIENNQDEATIGRLRAELRDQIGSLTVTPMDEIAIKVAAAYRERYWRSPEKRQQIIEDAAREMRREVEPNA